MPGQRQFYLGKGKLAIYWLIFTFWMLGFYPFLVQLGSFQMFEIIDGRLMLFFEGIYIVVGLILLSDRRDKIVVFSFMIMSLISTVIVNARPVTDWIAGLRFYCPMLFLLPVIRYATATVARREFFIELMDRSLYIFLWAQAPCMIFQYYYYGGWDYGGGSLGFYQSGVVSELIYTVSFYLLLRRWQPEHGYFWNLLRNWLLVFLLFPTFLNETKASFIFLVLYFLFLTPINRKFLKSMLIVVPMIAVAIFVFNYFYMNLYGKNSDTGEEVLTEEYFNFYVIGDDSSLDLMEMAYENSDVDEDQDFQRGLKWAALPWLMDDKDDSPGIWFWGNGTGILKGHSDENPSEMGAEYKWLFQGTQMTLEMLILECGIWGVIWFIFTMTTLFRSGNRHTGRQRQLTCYLIGLLAAVLFYNTSMNIIFFCLIFYYLAFLCAHWNFILEFRNIDPKRSIWSMGGLFTNVRLGNTRPEQILKHENTDCQ